MNLALPFRAVGKSGFSLRNLGVLRVSAVEIPRKNELTAETPSTPRGRRVFFRQLFKARKGPRGVRVA